MSFPGTLFIVHFAQRLFIEIQKQYTIVIKEYDSFPVEGWEIFFCLRKWTICWSTILYGISFTVIPPGLITSNILIRVKSYHLVIDFISSEPMRWLNEIFQLISKQSWSLMNSILMITGTVKYEIESSLTNTALSEKVYCQKRNISSWLIFIPISWMSL